MKLPRKFREMVRLFSSRSTVGVRKRHERGSVVRQSVRANAREYEEHENVQTRRST